MISGMLAEHESDRNNMTRGDARSSPGGRRGARAPTGVAPKTGLVVVVAGCTLALAACSSAVPTAAAPHHGLAVNGRSGHPVASTTTTTLGPTQRAVVSAWEDAERTLYGYMQEPPAPARAALVAGDTSATLWPDLGEYFANPALKSESLFLIGMTMQELHGPASYDLGHPVVSAMSASSATVTGCIYDSGTTTPSGAPGPANLDGGAGGGRGQWEMELVGASWKIVRFETTAVPKC